MIPMLRAAIAARGAVFATVLRRRLLQPVWTHVILLMLTIIILIGSFALPQSQSETYAANPGQGNVCSWYRIRSGDTLTRIASYYHTSIWKLARANYIRNINLIFAGQLLCIPTPARNKHTTHTSSGVLPNGAVRWYAYNALEFSNRQQVTQLIRQIAARYRLPANLLLAVAWQESGWTQHVIARDGGIGTMQLMPYTAMSINQTTHIRRDPYKLVDNIHLGATYLRWLWNSFHGNIYKVISGYNEGGWNVTHRGIFNWSYVNNVLYLMNIYR